MAAEVWPGLGPVVESENALDDAGKVFWNVNGAGAAAECAFGMLVIGEEYAEGRAQSGDGSRKYDRAARLADLHDGQVMLLGERFDLDNVARIGAVSAGELRAGHIVTFVGKRIGKLLGGCQILYALARPEDQTEPDLFIGDPGRPPPRDPRRVCRSLPGSATRFLFSAMNCSL